MNKHGDALLPSLCVILGASTGGPATLVDVLQQITDVKASCVIILQHLDQHLSSHLAAWLSDQTGLNIQQPSRTYPLKQGDVVLLTGSHWQMGTNQQLKVCEEAQSGVYFMPSIDLFMDSMVKHWQQQAKGVLLTGMGKDGAKGLLAMRQHGWGTYAQHEQDCLLYGMPKEAARMKAAKVIESPQNIGLALNHCIQYNALLHKT